MAINRVDGRLNDQSNTGASPVSIQNNHVQKRLDKSYFKPFMWNPVCSIHTSYWAPLNSTGAVFSHADFMYILILKHYITATPNRVEKGAADMCCDKKRGYPTIVTGKNNNNCTTVLA